MSLDFITPPAEEPVSLAELKAHLRITHAEEDAAILNFCRAARRAVEQRVSVALISQTWRWTLDRAPMHALVLPRSPVVSVDAVALINRIGVATPVDPALYEVETGRRGRLLLNGAVPWSGRALGSVRVDFTAGHANAAAVPPELKQAVLTIAAFFFENREAGAPERLFSTAQNVDGLLGAWKELRL